MMMGQSSPCFDILLKKSAICNWEEGREGGRERERERENHFSHHASSLLTTYSGVRNLMKSCAFLGCEAKSSAWFASSKSSNWKAGAHVQPTNEKWCSGSRDAAFNNGPELPSSSWGGMCKMSLVGYAPNNSMGFTSYWGVWPAAKSNPNTVCFMLPSLSSSNTCHKTATYHHHVCFHTKVTMIQNLQSNTINSITHVEIQQLKKKRIAFMGCEDQKEKDDITKILIEKKPWFIRAYNWRKRESHSWDVKTKKERKTESTKILMAKKRKKATIHHQNPQLGTSIFPRKTGWSWWWKSSWSLDTKRDLLSRVHRHRNAILQHKGCDEDMTQHLLAIGSRWLCSQDVLPCLPSPCTMAKQVKQKWITSIAFVATTKSISTQFPMCWRDPSKFFS